MLNMPTPPPTPTPMPTGLHWLWILPIVLMLSTAERHVCPDLQFRRMRQRLILLVDAV